MLVLQVLYTTFIATVNKMAKFVVAGRSDCPYFARAELLGDRLARNLPKFKLHKIMVQPDEWDDWLKGTCVEKGWQFSKSPMVWRELIDRGGKGVLIGGANEFQEYVKAYYDLESEMNSFDMRTISAENKITKDELDAEESAFKALSKPIHVCITNAANPVCYHLLNSIASGQVLGPNIELTIRLLASSEEDLEAVKGMAMEAEDLAHGLLRNVTVCTSIHKAFADCSVIILLDDILQEEGESKMDWLIRNEEIFNRYGTIITDNALKTCKVMVCGKGPLNFNANTLSKNAPGIARQNIVAVPTVVENNAKSVIGERLTVNPAGVVSLLVWGNINGTHHFDVSNCRIHGYDGAIWGPYWYSVSGVEMIHDNKWIQKEFAELVAGRDEKVASVLGHPPSLSTANAISTTLQYWCRGSPTGQVFSLGVHSEGWYGVPKNLFFSLPVTMDPKGYWHVVQDINLTFEVKEGIAAAIEDLRLEEAAFRGEEDKYKDSENQTEDGAGQAGEAAKDDEKKEDGQTEVPAETAEVANTDPATEGTAGETQPPGEVETTAETKESEEGVEGETTSAPESGAGEANLDGAETTQDAPAVEE